MTGGQRRARKKKIKKILHFIEHKKIFSLLSFLLNLISFLHLFYFLPHSRSPILMATAYSRDTIFLRTDFKNKSGKIHKIPYRCINYSEFIKMCIESENFEIIGERNNGGEAPLLCVRFPAMAKISNKALEMLVEYFQYRLEYPERQQEADNFALDETHNVIHEDDENFLSEKTYLQLVLLITIANFLNIPHLEKISTKKIAREVAKTPLNNISTEFAMNDDEYEEYC